MLYHIPLTRSNTRVTEPNEKSSAPERTIRLEKSLYGCFTINYEERQDYDSNDLRRENGYQLPDCCALAEAQACARSRAQRGSGSRQMVGDPARGFENGASEERA